MKMKKLINNLMVENVQASVEFYCGNLGFELFLAVPKGQQEAVKTLDSEAVYDFAIVRNGDIEFVLQSRSSLLEDFPHMPYMQGGISNILYFHVKDVESFFCEIKDRVNIVKGLYEAVYGMQEFYIKDPDGHILGFTEKA